MYILTTFHKTLLLCSVCQCKKRCCILTAPFTEQDVFLRTVEHRPFKESLSRHLIGLSQSTLQEEEVRPSNFQKRNQALTKDQSTSEELIRGKGKSKEMIAEKSNDRVGLSKDYLRTYLRLQRTYLFHQFEKKHKIKMSEWLLNVFLNPGPKYFYHLTSCSCS